MSQKTTISKDKESLEKIALDSNVFRNLNFINYLRQFKSEMKISIPTIVSFEIGYYFIANGITWENFLKEIGKFDGIFLEWDTILQKDVLKNALDNRITLPFRHHFRDFLIGTQCENLRLNIITITKITLNGSRVLKCTHPRNLSHIKSEILSRIHVNATAKSIIGYLKSLVI